MVTANLLGVDRGNSNTSKNVLLGSDWLDVKWVSTLVVSTEMIKNLPWWNRSYDVLVDHDV